MCYYRSVVVAVPETATFRLAVVYDHERVIVEQAIDDDQADTIDATLTALGFRIVGDSGLGLAAGERIVTRDSPHNWFNPGTGEWSTTPPR
ncbi:hypothetical protein A9X06_27445 [Mycobacterium sp. 852002-51759_SCH5129042]|nr:hypothetical protein A9X06_27445 [Mycobacterium sp. 852002-51759_SCH5129042]